MTTKLTLSDQELRHQFYALKTREDVAKLLDVDQQRIIYHLYIVPPSRRYTRFQLPKKDGGTREIHAPATALKILQRKLNQVLQAVYLEKPKPSAHGFIRGKSILTNAKTHARRRNILNLDLKDFFPSIHFGRVYRMFLGKPYYLSPQVATVLAQICCFNETTDQKGLPQGAPTSPVIANMICRKMDSQLQKLAEKYRCTYTRYADDITFSTNLMEFPSALATANDVGQITVGAELGQVIQQNYFAINENKIRLYRGKVVRKQVTGLTVNLFPNVRREYVRQLRAILHDWETNGVASVANTFFARFDPKKRHPENPESLFKQIVNGKIEYLGMVRGHDEIYARFHRQFARLAPEFAKQNPEPKRNVSIGMRQLFQEFIEVPRPAARAAVG